MWRWLLVIRRRLSCTSLKRSLLFSLACTIHLSLSPLSGCGLAACCIACHHFAISLHLAPHSIGPACQVITFCHRITFHRSRGLPFSHRSCSWKNIYFYGTRPLLLSLTISLPPPPPPPLPTFFPPPSTAPPPIPPLPPNLHSTKGPGNLFLRPFPFFPPPLPL